jgi:hypothetical protein
MGVLFEGIVGEAARDMSRSKTGEIESFSLVCGGLLR